jgi:hypothetical protein
VSDTQAGLPKSALEAFALRGAEEYLHEILGPEEGRDAMAAMVAQCTRMAVKTLMKQTTLRSSEPATSAESVSVPTAVLPEKRPRANMDAIRSARAYMLAQITQGLEVDEAHVAALTGWIPMTVQSVIAEVRAEVEAEQRKSPVKAPAAPVPTGVCETCGNPCARRFCSRSCSARRPRVKP